ncbi:glycerophosphodiester phosphodiesterase family protein [Flavobacterium frigidarium]|uniref:Glycerophosphodiester phosphodiesterase family protein n=1 Tax=Flavobacterium frigidarium TaxID=99286 RepID=A0ABV4K8X4_9FLAO
MKFYKLFLFCVIIASTSCKSVTEDKKVVKKNRADGAKIEVQGHRGQRGHSPENSISAFLKAIEKGVDVIEMDVVISKDGKVVVSHEPYMSSLYVLTPAGKSISKAEEKNFNLYEMTYDTIKMFDIGSQGNKNFPEQEKIKSYKPLLSEVIDSVENYVKSQNILSVKYNIEIKSIVSEYDKSQPKPLKFIKMVMGVIQEKGIENKMNIQSFDENILNEMNRIYPKVELSYLVSDEGIAKNMAKLNFTPEIYSPNFKLVKNKAFVDSIKQKKMRLIPWTVNEKANIEEMIKLKVDGIITDYPERVR